MQKSWDSRKARRILKCWYYFQYHLKNLTFDELRAARQLYSRLSYLSHRQQTILFQSFYYPTRNRHSHLIKTAQHYHCNYSKFTYLIHKLELEICQGYQSPNQSTGAINVIQFKRMNDAFRSLIKIIGTKVARYPQICRLDRLSSEDFPPHKKWQLAKCQNELKNWYYYENDLHDPRQIRTIAVARQLEIRLSYLSPRALKILRAYYYYPKEQQRQIRSEQLAKENNINLATLLIDRTQAFHQLQDPHSLPKMTFNDDEEWEADNDLITIQSITTTLFKN